MAFVVSWRPARKSQTPKCVILNVDKVRGQRQVSNAETVKFKTTDKLRHSKV